MLYYIVILLHVVLHYMTLQKPYISIENNYMKMLIILLYCYIVIYVVIYSYVIILLYVV